MVSPLILEDYEVLRIFVHGEGLCGLLQKCANNPPDSQLKSSPGSMASDAHHRSAAFISSGVFEKEPDLSARITQSWCYLPKGSG